VAGLTLEDVARKVGVSRSTVSRVVNGHPHVRDDVRQRVLQVIEETGYHPNAAARTLASQRSRMIGLVLPRTVNSFFTDPYFPQFTQGIAQACNQLDYTLGLFLAGTREDEEKLFPRVSRRGFLDGVLVQSGHGQIGERLTERLIKSSIPLVIVGRPTQPDGASYIDVDNAEAAYTAVSHLSRLGYQRIGTITGPASSTVGIDRREGYLRAMTERGRAVEDCLVTEGDFTEAGGYYAMQRLLPARPDAVFAASDIMAIGAMRAIREAHLHVPNDIALVGFDDIPLAALSDPQLTTVRQHVLQFGISAVELLTDIIENGLTPQRRIIMATELVIRESCGAHRRR
jgi:LacI family transcriptional regulator